MDSSPRRHVILAAVLLSVAVATYGILRAAGLDPGASVHKVRVRASTYMWKHFMCERASQCLLCQIPHLCEWVCVCERERECVCVHVVRMENFVQQSM